MALRSRFGSRVAMPSVTTRKGQTKQVSFKGGVDTYSDNDDVKPSQLVAAIDARYIRIGRYKTRKGLDRYTIPIGETVRGSQTSTAGAGVVTVDGSHSVAQQLTMSAAGLATKAEINIRSTSSSRGTLLVEIYTNASGTLGALLASSSLQPSAVGSSFSYVPAFFVEAPALTNGQAVWLVVRPQNDSVGAYEVSTTTNSSLALLRSGETTWVSQSYSVNAKLSLSDAGPVKNVYRAYRSNGLRVTMFAHGTSMYTVDDVTGIAMAIKTGLSASATRYRFAMAQDAVYFINEYEKPYKYDLVTGTVTQITAAPAVPYLIIEHKGLIFYGNSTDRSQTFFTNFGVYDAFKSTDFLTVMAPKSPDSHVAYAKLNGVFYIFARRNKFVVFGDNNATWSLDEAPSQRGTFSQESVAYDADTIYHANDDGIWAFNGTEDRNLAKDFLNQYKAILNKETIKLELFNNRLYVFYTPAGAAENRECFVYNVLLGVFESLDTGTFVGSTFARLAQDEMFIQGSNRVGALYFGERESNNYDNLGRQLHYELATSFGHFDAPGQFKRIPKWRPVFNAATGEYSVECGYAIDGSDEVTWTDVSLAANSPRFNTGLLFDTGVRFATGGSAISPTNLFIPGTFKRAQRRYRHIAAHEPVEFDSEILTIETQGLL